MGYKTILVHCDTAKTSAGRIAVARDLAVRFGAHLIGLHVRQRFEAPMFTDATMALDTLYKTYEAAVKAEETASATMFRGALGDTAGEWRVAEGPADEAVVAAARSADLVVLGQREPEPLPSAPPADLAEKVALASERPVLVVPHIGVARTPGRTVLLCWNGRREAARAATGALPLLRRADSVTVLTIDPRKAADAGRVQPGADVAQWLARHGVKVTIERDSAADSDVGTVILSRAADCDADLIVMGIYGHSRLREMVLGGASRTLLASMTAPLLIAH